MRPCVAVADGRCSATCARIGLKEGETATFHLKTFSFSVHFKRFNSVVDTLLSKSPFSVFSLLPVIVSACLKSLFLSPSERAQSEKNAAL